MVRQAAALFTFHTCFELVQLGIAVCRVDAEGFNLKILIAQAQHGRMMDQRQLTGPNIPQTFLAIAEQVYLVQVGNLSVD